MATYIEKDREKITVPWETSFHGTDSNSETPEKYFFLSEILLQMFGTEKCPHMTNMKVKVTSELMFLLVIHDYH